MPRRSLRSRLAVSPHSNEHSSKFAKINSTAAASVKSQFFFTLIPTRFSQHTISSVGSAYLQWLFQQYDREQEEISHLLKILPEEEGPEDFSEIHRLISRAQQRQKGFLAKSATLSSQIFTTAQQWERIIFEFAQRKSLNCPWFL